MFFENGFKRQKGWKNNCVGKTVGLEMTMHRNEEVLGILALHFRGLSDLVSYVFSNSLVTYFRSSAGSICSQHIGLIFSLSSVAGPAAREKQINELKEAIEAMMINLGRLRDSFTHCPGSIENGKCVGTEDPVAVKAKRVAVDAMRAAVKAKRLAVNAKRTAVHKDSGAGNGKRGNILPLFLRRIVADTKGL